MADDPKKVEAQDPNAQTPAEAPETPEPQPTPELSPRARAEKEVWAAANKRRAVEAAEPLPPVEGEAPPAAPAPEPEKPVEGEEPAPEAAADGGVNPPAQPEAEEEEVELLVNGKPMKFKKSQIEEAGRRTLQKDAAADMKLEIASRLLREAEERAGKQPPSKEGAQPPAEPSKPSVQEKSDAELAELLQYGTKEQAASAIAEIRRRDTGADTQQGLQEFIAKQLPAALDARLAFHEAVRTARSDYKDIFVDPYLSTLFHVQEHRAREAGDARPHAELYKEIGDGIRKHFKLATPSKDAPSLEERKEVKRAAPSLPRPAASRVETGGPEKPLTPEAARERALAAMKASRGHTETLKKY